MPRIGRELVRLAQERVITYERAIDTYREGDPMRVRLKKRLAEAREDLANKSELLHREENPN